MFRPFTHPTTPFALREIEGRRDAPNPIPPQPVILAKAGISPPG